MNAKIKYNLLEYWEYLGGIFGVYKNYLNVSVYPANLSKIYPFFSSYP